MHLGVLYVKTTRMSLMKKFENVYHSGHLFVQTPFLSPIFEELLKYRTTAVNYNFSYGAHVNLVIVNNRT